VLLSTGLWVIVTFQQDPDVTDVVSAIPVDVQNVPRTVLVEPSTTAIEVTVTAPQDSWPQLKADRFHAVLDVGKVQPGVQDVDVRVTVSDPQAQIEAITPDKIAVRVDPLVSKQVPVQIVTQGAVAPFYTSGAASATPAQITVSGPKSNVDQVSAAVIQVSLDGLTRSVDQTVTPVPESTSGTKVDRVTFQPEAVVVSVPVEQQLEYKTLPVQANVQGTSALGYITAGVQVDPNTVTLVGDPKTLNDLQFVTTQPVDISGATSDLQVSTGLALPGTVALAQSQSIVVRVLVAMANGSTTILVAPKVQNAATGVTYVMTPPSLNVTLSGPVPVLSRLTADDVTAVVDVHNATGGTQTLAPQVTVPPLVKVQAVQPTAIVVATK
jgi:YbbR domain-containing protein